MRSQIKRGLQSIAAVATLALVLSACTTSHQTTAQTKAVQANQSLQSQIYNPKYNIEFNNYNNRQKIADDPTTILWCTEYFNNPNTRPITVPIVGKLTSSNKRPYATTQVDTSSGNTYSPELPGPDNMYGSSSEYRYGFSPAGVYFDFTNVTSICTTQPMTYQATDTTVVLKVDDQLNAAAQAARNALSKGVQANGSITKGASDQAQTILENATNGVTK